MIATINKILPFINSNAASHLHSVAELVGDVADLLKGVANVAVALQKVEHGLSKDFEGETHVAIEVEGVEHQDTEMLAGGVLAI